METAESLLAVALLVGVMVVLVHRAGTRDATPEERARTEEILNTPRERPSLAQINQVLLFVVLAGVILFALGIIRCEAVVTTS